MILSRREKILLILFIYLAIFTVFYRLCYQPLCQQVEVIINQNAQLRKYLAELDKEKENIKTESDKEKIAQEYRVLLQKLPSEPLPLEAVRYFEQTAEQSGIKLVSINHQNPSPKNIKNGSRENLNQSEAQANSLQFKIISIGTYDSLLTFTKKIENAPREFAVENLLITRLANEDFQTPVENIAQVNADSNLSNRFQMVMDIKAYYLSNQKY